jgi:hypothetical protein
MEEWVPDVQEMLAQAANVDMKYFGEITIRRICPSAKLLRDFFRGTAKLRSAVTIPGSIAVDTAGVDVASDLIEIRMEEFGKFEAFRPQHFVDMIPSL